MSIKVETSPGGVKFIRTSKKGKLTGMTLPADRKRRAWIGSSATSQQKTDVTKPVGS